LHERSIAQSVVDIARRQARGQRVTRVRVSVGCLREVVPTDLHRSFRVLAQGTEVDGADLVIDEIPAIALCRSCRCASLSDSRPLACHACRGADLHLASGDELRVESVETARVPVGMVPQ